VIFNLYIFLPSLVLYEQSYERPGILNEIGMERRDIFFSFLSFSLPRKQNVDIDFNKIVEVALLKTPLELNYWKTSGVEML